MLLTVLLVHLAAAIVSPLLFTARAYRAWRGRNPAEGLLRWLPHAVDTVLFGAGVALAIIAYIYAVAFTMRPVPWE